jgi:hypothetical protein
MPKLNPAAPAFKTFFSRGDTRTAEKAAKAVDKGKEKESHKKMDLISDAVSDELSRDSLSIHTQNSMAGSHDSLDRPLSATPSESLTQSGATAKDRESFIQKITRKSSSTKFNIAGPWKEKFGKKNAGSTGEPVTPGEMDDGESSQLGRSGESISSSPNPHTGGRSGIGWGTLRRKQRKGDKATSEASEKGGETGDEE